MLVEGHSHNDPWFVTTIVLIAAISGLALASVIDHVPWSKVVAIIRRGFAYFVDHLPWLKRS
jgi:hypothetical protein